MGKKVTICSVVFIIFLSAVGAYFYNTYNTPHRESPVRIGYLNIVASLPLFIAEEKGFFTEEGIQYEVTSFATSNQLVDAILAGNIDFFIESSAVPALAADLQSPGKLKIFSISEITPETPFDSLLTKDTSQITKLTDLAGKKIGVFPGSTATNLLKKFLKDKGIETSAIEFIPIPPQNQLTALLEGSVDALHAYEPTTAIALTKGGVKKIFGSVYAEMLSPNPQGVAVINTAFSVNNSKVASRVINAFENAMRFMKQHDIESRQILSKRMNINEKIAKNVVFLYMLPHNQIPSDILQKYADMLTELNELSGRVDVQKLIYNN